MKEDRQNGKEGEREKFHMSCIGKLILVLCQGGTMTVEPASEHYWPPHRRRWASAGNSSYLYWVVGSLIQQRTEQTCGQQPLSLSLRICGFMVPVCHCVCVCPSVWAWCKRAPALTVNMKRGFVRSAIENSISNLSVPRGFFYFHPNNNKKE